MITYHYDTTGLYVGCSELDNSDKCPITGEYLIPAFTTTISPPAIPDGKRAYFINGTWVLRKIKQYCYYNNGLSYKEVPYDYAAQDGEVLFDAVPTEDELANTFPEYLMAIKQQKINQLNAEYQVKLNALSSAYPKASLNDGNNVTTKQEALAAQFQSIMADYAIAKNTILNDTDSKTRLKSTEVVYFCPFCGEKLTWDSDGSASGSGFPCWYCTECPWLTASNDEFPAQS